jgi:hypothetical protein
MPISDQQIRQNLNDLLRRSIARHGSLRAAAVDDFKYRIIHLRLFFGVDGVLSRAWRFAPAVEERARELCDELEELVAGAKVYPIPERMAEIAQTDDAFQSFMDLAKPKS